MAPKGTDAGFGDWEAISESTGSSVEHIFFEIPSTGEYEFWVRQRTVPTGPRQDYAVAWWYGLAPEIGTPLSGDFNNDGIVDGADFLAWQRDTGLGDLADWEAGFGTSTPLAASSLAVPEPQSLTLLAIALAAWPLQRSGKRW